MHSHPVPGNFLAPADPYRIVALDVVEKARQAHCPRGKAADPTMQADTHHLRSPRALRPELVEGVLEQAEEVLT
jgi:hypothetical protein